MTEKQIRVRQLRQRLASLSEAERQELAKRGIIATVEGRALSLHNTYMVYLQCNGHQPTVVGGYNQWKRAGRQVMKGEHGYTILFPVGQKNLDGEITEAHTFYTGTVFDISQTQPLDGPSPAPTPPTPAAPAPQAHKNDEMKGWTLV